MLATQETLTDFHGDEAKKKVFCKKVSKWPTQKNIFFASTSGKSVKVFWVAGMGRNFDHYPGFHPKTI